MNIVISTVSSELLGESVPFGSSFPPVSPAPSLPGLLPPLHAVIAKANASRIDRTSMPFLLADDLLKRTPPV